MAALYRALKRRKMLSSVKEDAPSQLARVLGTWDLTTLGVGSTLGVGVYVLAGNVSRNMAGPAVVISFLIAAVTSVFAGLCYAEFGARVPRAGSAYIYSYVTVGEFIAFVVGWNLILEYVIGSASVARGLTVYFDSLINGSMIDAFKYAAPLHVSYLSPYFDFMALGTSIILAVILALGVRESTLLNSIFTLLNVVVVLFVIIIGGFEANIQNWEILKEDIPQDANGGEGGFAPFGVTGVLMGAATCFYGFVGFDCIATTGEEVKNPQRAIPIAIIVSLLIIFLAYFGVSAVLTLMWPYYYQNENAPIPYVFEQIGMAWAQWTVAVGGTFGLIASLFGAMFPLPRLIYAMAKDGLLFRSLGTVNKRFHTPLVGTLLAGLLSGLMAALFELKHLVEMMSIGTLMAYTIVAACVLLLRYEFQHDADLPEYIPLRTATEDILEDDQNEYTDSPSEEDYQIISADCVESTRLVPFDEKATLHTIAKQLLNKNHLEQPSPLSSNIVAFEVVLYCILCVVLGVALTQLNHIWAAVTTGLCLILQGVLLLSMSFQPVTSKSLPFKVPLVPFIPALSILLNVYLIMMLSRETWTRFAIWMGIGLLLYLLYGVRNSRGIYIRECRILREPEVQIVVQGPSAPTSRSTSVVLDIEKLNEVSSNTPDLLESDDSQSYEDTVKKDTKKYSMKENGVVPNGRIGMQSLQKDITSDANKNIGVPLEVRKPNMNTEIMHNKGMSLSSKPNTNKELIHNKGMDLSSTLTKRYVNEMKPKTKSIISTKGKDIIMDSSTHSKVHYGIKNHSTLYKEKSPKLTLDTSLTKSEPDLLVKKLSTAPMQGLKSSTGTEVEYRTVLKPVMNSTVNIPHTLEQTSNKSYVSVLPVDSSTRTDDSWIGGNISLRPVKKIQETSTKFGKDVTDINSKVTTPKRLTVFNKPEGVNLKSQHIPYTHQKKPPFSDSGVPGETASAVEKESIKKMLEDMLSARFGNKNLSETVSSRQSHAPIKPAQSSVQETPTVASPTQVLHTPTLKDPLYPPPPPPAPPSTSSSLILLPPPPPPPMPQVLTQLSIAQQHPVLPLSAPLLILKQTKSSPSLNTQSPSSDFERTRMQRVLMGDVLASLKFMMRHEKKGSEESSCTTNSFPSINDADDDSDGEVFTTPEEMLQKSSVLLAEESNTLAIA